MDRSRKSESARQELQYLQSFTENIRRPGEGENTYRYGDPSRGENRSSDDGDALQKNRETMQQYEYVFNEANRLMILSQHEVARCAHRHIKWLQLRTMQEMQKTSNRFQEIQQQIDTLDERQMQTLEVLERMERRYEEAQQSPRQHRASSQQRQNPYSEGDVSQQQGQQLLHKQQREERRQQLEQQNQQQQEQQLLHKQQREERRQQLKQQNPQPPPPQPSPHPKGNLLRDQQRRPQSRQEHHGPRVSAPKQKRAKSTLV